MISSQTLASILSRRLFPTVILTCLLCAASSPVNSQQRLSLDEDEPNTHLILESSLIHEVQLPEETDTQAASEDPMPARNAQSGQVDWGETKIPEGTFASIKDVFQMPEKDTLALSLGQLLHLANGDNIEIKVGEQDVKAKSRDVWLKLSDLLPDMGLSHSQSRFTGQIQGFGSQTFTINQTTIQPMVTANYTVYTGGENLFRIWATKRRRDAQKAQLESTRQAILAEVAKTYYDLKKFYWGRGIAIQGMLETQLEVDITQSRFDNGIGVKVDLLQSQSNYQTFAFNKVEAENQIAQKGHRLNQLLNLDFDVQLIPDELETDIHPLVDKRLTIEQLKAIAIENNPDLKNIKNLQQASVADMREKIASIMPEVTLQSRYSAVGTKYNRLSPNLFAGFEVTMDLLNNLGAERPLEIAQLDAIKKGLRYSYDLQQTEVLESVYNTYVSLKAQEAQIDLARKRLALSREAFYFAIGRLKAGVGTTLQVQDALTNLTQSRVDLLNAFIGYNQTQVDLLQALGVVSVTTLTEGYQSDGNPQS